MSKRTYKNRSSGLTEDQKRYVGLDCEMVGVAPNPGDIYPERSILAQVSIVDWNGRVIYQSYVSPTEPVINYRTEWSGITPEILEEQGRPFIKVRREVLSQIKNKIVVGHGLENDFAVLNIDPTRVETRDTAHVPALQKQLRDGSYGPRKLKDLAREYLNKNIQSGSHDPAEDARAAMDLFKALRYELFESYEFPQYTQANMNAFVSMLSSMDIQAHGQKKQRRGYKKTRKNKVYH